MAFEIVREQDNKWFERTIYAFGKTDSDASRPDGGLIFDADGNLYGTSSAGGNHCNPIGCGAVFELSPTSVGAWRETLLYSFTGGSDGGRPEGGLVFGTDGNLYGTTSQGGDVKCVIHGSTGCGTLFKLAPESSHQWTETVLHEFERDARGTTPFSTPILDSSGNLYATTQGGYNEGVVFEVTQKNGQWQERVLENFRAGDGGFPTAPPTLAEGGKMFGTTSGDGAYGDIEIGGYGAVYELLPGEHETVREVVIHNFNGKDGAVPLSSVILDGKGNLYGTTQRGGGTGCGVVFQLSQRRERGMRPFFTPFPKATAAARRTVWCSTLPEICMEQPATVAPPVTAWSLSYRPVQMAHGRKGSCTPSPAAATVVVRLEDSFSTTPEPYTAVYGGNNGCQTNWTTGCGTVFEMNPSSNGWTFTVLYTFNGNDGGKPSGGSRLRS